MGTMRAYLRRALPALAGALLVAAIYRIVRGTWDTGAVVAPLLGAAIVYLLMIARAKPGGC